MDQHQLLYMLLVVVLGRVVAQGFPLAAAAHPLLVLVGQFWLLLLAVAVLVVANSKLLVVLVVR
jgi:hypothetical protein